MEEFGYEKLDVYQRAMEFLAQAYALIDRLPKGYSTLADQLRRSSLSIPLNIAEGSGKWTAPDRCRFYDIARGSALECAAALDVAVVKKALRAEEITDAKQVMVAVVSMLVALIKSVSPNRNYQRPEDKV